jgi:hypothetical protein
LANIRFHLDEHLPNGLARALRRHGVEAETSAEAGLLGTSDVAHVEHAPERQQMIVTQDIDYLILHAQARPHSDIAYCSHDPHLIGHIGHLVEALLLIHAIYEAEEMSGRVEYV